MHNTRERARFFLDRMIIVEKITTWQNKRLSFDMYTYIFLLLSLCSHCVLSNAKKEFSREAKYYNSGDCKTDYIFKYIFVILYLPSWNAFRIEKNTHKHSWK